MACFQDTCVLESDVVLVLDCSGHRLLGCQRYSVILRTVQICDGVGGISSLCQRRQESLNWSLEKLRNPTLLFCWW